jgi:hypothetical protein
MLNKMLHWHGRGAGHNKHPAAETLQMMDATFPSTSDETEFTQKFIHKKSSSIGEVMKPSSHHRHLDYAGTMDSDAADSNNCLDTDDPNRGATLEETSSSDGDEDDYITPEDGGRYDGNHDAFGNEGTNHTSSNRDRLVMEQGGHVTEPFSSSAHDDVGVHDDDDLRAGEALQRENRSWLTDAQRLAISVHDRTVAGAYDSDGDDSSEEGEEGNSCSSGEEFINLAHEAKITAGAPSSSRNRCLPNGVVRGGGARVTMQSSGDESHYYEDDEVATPLEYVDTEEQAFSFGTRSREEEYEGEDQITYAGQSYELSMSHHLRRSSAYDGVDRQVSLEATSVGYETTAECSKTLNTNLETLHTDLEGVHYIPTMNEHGMIVQDPAFHARLQGYGDHGFGAEGESYEDEATYDGPPQGGPYLYEDDGTRFTGHDDHNYTFEDETYTEHFREQETYQDTFTEHTRETHATSYEGYPKVISQLVNSYLSDDRSSAASWEEGSFAGASRAISRIDSVEDGSSDDGSFEGSESCSDDDERSHTEHNSTLFGLLKSKLQHLKDRSHLSDDEDDGDTEIEYLPDATPSNKSAEAKRAKKRNSIDKRRRRRSKKESESLIGRLGELGMDLLNDTMTPKTSTKSPRRRKDDEDQTTRIVNSLRDIFSCGAPRRY